MSALDKETRIERADLVAKQFGGIQPQLEAFYIHSIIYAAERSTAAFIRFETALEEAASDLQIFSNVQEAIGHAAAVSRFFWPKDTTNQLSVARGRRLQLAFGIDDTSPIRWRRLRNAFEHFDEDLDDFLLEDHVGYFFPNPIVGHHTLADEAIGHIFKLVDPENGNCVVLGRKFEYRPIQLEVQRVLNRAREMDVAGCRLPRPRNPHLEEP